VSALAVGTRVRVKQLEHSSDLLDGCTVRPEVGEEGHVHVCDLSKAREKHVVRLQLGSGRWYLDERDLEVLP